MYVDYVAVLCLRYATLLLTCEEQRQRNVAKETVTPSIMYVKVLQYQLGLCQYL